MNVKWACVSYLFFQTEATQTKHHLNIKYFHQNNLHNLELSNHKFCYINDNNSQMKAKSPLIVPNARYTSKIFMAWPCYQLAYDNDFIFA